jgi:hypothetical protein
MFFFLNVYGFYSFFAKIIFVWAKEVGSDLTSIYYFNSNKFVSEMTLAYFSGG